MGASTTPVAPSIALSGEGHPVFVDPSGRRTRWLSRLAKLVGWCVVVYIALVGASLARAPWAPRLSLPGLGSLVPQLAQASPPSLGAGAIVTPSPTGNSAVGAHPPGAGGNLPPVPGSPGLVPGAVAHPQPGAVSGPSASTGRGQPSSGASVPRGQPQSPPSGQGLPPTIGNGSPATTGHGPPATTGNGQPSPTNNGHGPSVTTGNGQPNPATSGTSPSQAGIHRHAFP